MQDYRSPDCGPGAIGLREGVRESRRRESPDVVTDAPAGSPDIAALSGRPVGGVGERGTLIREGMGTAQRGHTRRLVASRRRRGRSPRQP
jgi:hypothetical protein